METNGVVAGGVDRASVRGKVSGTVGEADVDDDLGAVGGDVDVLRVSETGL